MANVQRVAYIRVSAADQNLARQREDVGPVDRIFEEVQSGKDRTGRPVLAECLAYVREGDTLVVPSMDRLARSLMDLHQLVQQITGKGVAVEFVKERRVYTQGDEDPMNTLMLQILGAFAEFERRLIKDRQADGIAIAKTTPGKYKGRKSKFTAEDIARMQSLIDQGWSKAKVGAEFKVDRSTIYRALATAKARATEGEEGKRRES